MEAGRKHFQLLVKNIAKYFKVFELKEYHTKLLLHLKHTISKILQNVF